jgi:Ca2+-binding EF-hand superfamily protein
MDSLKPNKGKEQDARNMFRMMDKDGNGLMEFSEFVLVLILPKSAEQFAHRESIYYYHCTIHVKNYNHLIPTICTA